MHTVVKGDIAVAALVLRLLRKNWIVLKPISELSRYDLVIDRGSGFERIQCKTGHLKGGSVRFNSCSFSAKGSRHYRGESDLFGVYCLQNEKCYLIPVNQVGTRFGVLRIDPARNGQKKNVRLAAGYEI